MFLKFRLTIHLHCDHKVLLALLTKNFSRKRLHFLLPYVFMAAHLILLLMYTTVIPLLTLIY
jgi:hypothetical protein